ncbi:TrbI/VirB10 family protein [Erythrobacter sp. HKB08]|uniref:TrbI/VirB10 family protein n=1 Tax=Erythrobacter sp. HKB08 TaxID=2502843 RepID=UPI001008945F|nr:TrbI/VirB10 family protein [Erythrobacter sp. HKB08]
MADTATPKDDGLPVVAADKPGNLGLYAFLLVALLGSIGIFMAMNASRTADQSPMLQPERGIAGGRISSPAPLAVPGRFDLAPPPPIARQARPPIAAAPIRLQRAEPLPPPSSSAVESLPPPPSFQPAPPPPSVVFDRTFGSGDQVTQAISTETGRVTANRFSNPGYTIPKGTVIPAVLETALDSTRPGGVRALVQLDVRGFDGSRVLIQRGSRLYGEYEADLQPGQKRARVRWTRLIRPDGVTIALDSPASDPLGRAGIKGDVDTKFWQRFGGAVLQSVLDIGVGIATSEATDGVIVALPGSTQNVQVQDGNRVLPTLKVRHGTSVSVFVARDLDFSTVDG